MAISVVTRFISLPTVVKNANVNTFMCNKYPNVSRHLTTIRFCTRQSSENEDLDFPPEEKTTAPPAVMSSHMKRYLERAKAHEDFMKKEVAEYEIGLRHLANIVGTDVKTLKKHGTDKYIEYLFPSGLYDKSARPVFKHPNELYPAKKEAEFDYSGRPHHSFFYTAKPNYYKLLHDLSHWYINLNRIEDAARRKMKTAETLQNRMDYEDLLPISKTDLESIIKEELLQKEYDYFAATVQRLVEHPFSTDAKTIINTYMSQKAFSDTHIASLPVEYDENRRPFVKVTQCMRKSTRGEVIVYGDGTGNIEINGQDILYFKEQHFREQVVFPLIFTEMGDKVDIVAQMNDGGPAGQAGAMRWGISQGLLSFVSPEMRLKMKLAGLLTRDWRKRERKKVGQEGARRKFTWKKR